MERPEKRTWGDDGDLLGKKPGNGEDEPKPRVLRWFFKFLAGAMLAAIAVSLIAYRVCKALGF